MLQAAADSLEIALNFALPYHHGAVAPPAKIVKRASVAKSVGSEFGLPEFAIAFWNRRAVTTFVRMPITAVDKHCPAIRTVCNVG
jgi:hypothetical protein